MVTKGETRTLYVVRYRNDPRFKGCDEFLQTIGHTAILQDALITDHESAADNALRFPTIDNAHRVAEIVPVKVHTATTYVLMEP